jgi:hypothetical protein
VNAAGVSVNTSTGALCTSTTCVLNAYGNYTDSTTGLACTPSTTGTCSLNASGYYVNTVTGTICSAATTTGGCIQTPQGYYINTTTGAICSTTYISGTNYYPTGYSGVPVSNPCSYWGPSFFPGYVNGTLMCVSNY